MIGAFMIKFVALRELSSSPKGLPASKFIRMTLPSNPTREQLLLLLGTISSELLLIPDPMLKLHVFGYGVMQMTCETWNVRISLSLEILSEFPSTTDAVQSFAQTTSYFMKARKLHLQSIIR